MAQMVSDEEGMPVHRLEFFKNLCKHQAAQISDLSAHVTTQQEHIVRLEEYISKLEAKVISMPSCGVADPLVNPLASEGSAPGGVSHHNPSRRVSEKGKEKEVKLEEDILRLPRGLSEEHTPAMISGGVVGHATTTRPAKDNQPIVRDATSTASGPWKGDVDSNVSTVIEQPSRSRLLLPTPESNPPHNASASESAPGGSPSPSNLGRHSASRLQALLLEIQRIREYRAIPRRNSVLDSLKADLPHPPIRGSQLVGARADVPPNHSKTSHTKTPAGEPRTAAPSDVPAALAEGIQISAMHFAQVPIERRPTKQVEAVQRVQTCQPSGPPEIVLGPGQINPPATVWGQLLQDRSEASAAWIAGSRTVGATILGGAIGARDSVVAVFPGLEPLHETGRNPQQQQQRQADIGPGVVEDQAIEVRKRKAEEFYLPLSSIKPKSKKVKKKMRDVQMPPPTVIQSMKRQPASDKPSSLAYLNPLDLDRMRTNLYHAKGEGRTDGAQSDKPDASSTSYLERQERTLETLRRMVAGLSPAALSTIISASPVTPSKEGNRPGPWD